MSLDRELLLGLMALSGLRVRLYAFEATVRKEVGSCGPKALRQAVSGIPELQMDDKDIFWSPAELHRQTQRLVDTEPGRVRKEIGSWGMGIYNRMRLAAYLNDAVTFRSLHAREWPASKWAVASFGELDVQFVTTREPSIARRLVESWQYQLWEQGAWTPELEAVLEPGSFPSIELALARHQEVPIKGPVRQSGYLGVKLLFEGNLEGAYDEFSKRVSKRLPAFPGLLARLVGLAVEDGNLLRHRNLAEADNYSRLSELLYKLAFSPEYPEVMPDPGAGLETAVLRALKQVPNDRLPRCGFPALDNSDRWFSPLRAQWKRWLDKLAGIQVAPARPSGKRLVWHLADRWVTVYREKDLVRPASLPHLIRNMPPDLDDQDRSALLRLRVSRHGDGELTAEAARSLIGHPNLHYGDKKRELFEEPQRIVVERGPEGFLVRLIPHFEVGENFQLRPDGPHRLALCVESAAGKKLGAIMHEQEPVPFEAEAQLREALRNLPVEWPTDDELFESLRSQLSAG